jgi:hypothetical protein
MTRRTTIRKHSGGWFALIEILGLRRTTDQHDKGGKSE